MAIDMKRMIAEAARTLLVDKKVKKLTVKDIVEECQITRQSFYYHFEDIPSLLRWVLEQSADQMIKEIHGQKKAEDALRHFFLTSVNVAPYIRKTMQSNYGDEIEKLLREQIYRMFEYVVEKEELYQDRSPFERKLILRYHTQAIMGILRDWTEEDTKHLDQIVHGVYLLMWGRISPMPEEKEKNA